MGGKGWGGKGWSGGQGSKGKGPNHTPGWNKGGGKPFQGSLQQHFEDRCCNLDQKLSDKDSSQDARMEELGSLVQEHHAQLTNQYGYLSEQFSVAQATVAERLTAHGRHISDICGNMDNKFLDSCI